MKLDMTKVKNQNKIRLGVIQQNQAGSFNLELDKQDTLMRLYGLVSKLSGFDEDDFRLYLGDQVLPNSASTMASYQMLDSEFLELKIIPKSPVEDVGGPLRKVVSADAIMFSPRMRNSLPKIVLPKNMRKSVGMEPQHIRTPRKRIRASKIDCFFRLPIQMQTQIKEAFYQDIINSQNLTIVLENKYPELIKALFYETPKFYEMLTPELMLEIDGIEEALKEAGKYSDSEEDEEGDEQEITIEDVSAKDVLHVTASMNGIEMPLLFDCMSMDTTMSFGAYFAMFPESQDLPPNGLLKDDLVFPDAPESSPITIEVTLEHDTEPWIKAGLEFMYDHGVSINFGTNDVTINGDAIPFS